MQVFTTERLIVKVLEAKDWEYFRELLTHPKIIDPIPHEEPDEQEVRKKFNANVGVKDQPKKSQPRIWGIFERGKAEMIGLAAILTNDEEDWELGYRFRVKYWGKGYGTEIARGTVRYCFEVLDYDKITADVDIENIASKKILEKLMKLKKEFYNEEDKCLDQRYELYKKDWI